MKGKIAMGSCVKCPNCGAEISGGASFCPHCGERLTVDAPSQSERAVSCENGNAEVSKINCPGCGKEVNGGASVCPNCGYSLQAPKKKGPSALQIVLIVLLVIFLAPVALLSGCFAIGTVASMVSPSSETSSTEQINELQVGSAFTIDDIEFTIKEVGYGTQLSGDYLYIDYTGTNNSEEARAILLSGELYGPDGKEFNSVYVVGLSDFDTTHGDSVLPGASDGDRIGFETSRESGEYTFVIDEPGFDGELKFKVKFPKNKNSSPKISFDEE